MGGSCMMALPLRSEGQRAAQNLWLFDLGTA